VHYYGDDEDAVKEARKWVSSQGGWVLVRRTVTYGPWEEVRSE